jgi:predicted nucleic acid-binding protein
MAFVLDCSVTMAWVFPDEASESTDALRESLLTYRAVVPVLWPVEVANVLLVATRRGRVTENDWPRIRDDLAALPIDVDPES